MIITTIVLDLDGPLLDIMHRHYKCYSDIMTAQGYLPIPIDRYWDMKRNRVNREMLLSLSNAADIYDEFLASWIEKIENREYLALDRLQDGAIDVIRGWKEAGIRLLLATMRNNSTNLHWQLGELGIKRFFDEVVVAGCRQSGPAKYELIRPLLDSKCLDGVIWVGDTEVDIQAARELGVKACALTCGLRAEKYLASIYPDILAKNLHSLAMGQLLSHNIEVQFKGGSQDPGELE